MTATVIIDLGTGHVSWLACSKRKQAACGFCNLVGEEWMSHVEVIACDMNTDSGRAFPECYPHLDIVYDRFHIVKNSSGKVISEVGKGEQTRLRNEGDAGAARDLKHSKYILMSSPETRKRKDQDARKAGSYREEEGSSARRRPCRREAAARGTWRSFRRTSSPSACDIVKEMLDRVYGYRQQKRMRDAMERIVEVCRGTDDRHFVWFTRLAENHMDGIAAHASHHISSGKVEGINQMLKTLRRAG